ncbi:MAG: flagellar biosynthesis protein FliQ [Rhodospirillaceae bacterium]|nr:flagellar biosynthesis protein FliQ [Rhodospirillaceae bacterium]
MTETTVLEIGRQAVFTLLMVGAPVMLIALTVGLLISLFQALTQIQEMTLVFVPKILVIFISLLVLLPFMMSTMISFGHALFDMIVSMGT